MNCDSTKRITHPCLTIRSIGRANTLIHLGSYGWIASNLKRIRLILIKCCAISIIIFTIIMLETVRLCRINCRSCVYKSTTSYIFLWPQTWRCLLNILRVYVKSASRVVDWICSGLVAFVASRIVWTLLILPSFVILRIWRLNRRSFVPTIINIWSFSPTLALTFIQYFIRS